MVVSVKKEINLNGICTQDLVIAVKKGNKHNRICTPDLTKQEGQDGPVLLT